jgi:hypothetical protein
VLELKARQTVHVVNDGLGSRKGRGEATLVDDLGTSLLYNGHEVSLLKVSLR